jgi:hypothetical protein
MVCSPDRALLHQAQDAGVAGVAADGAVEDAAAVDGAGAVGTWPVHWTLVSPALQAGALVTDTSMIRPPEMQP